MEFCQTDAVKVIHSDMVADLCLQFEKVARFSQCYKAKNGFQYCIYHLLDC